MDPLITALAPIFVAGLAIQQLLETLDIILQKLFDKAWKSYVMSGIALVLGLLFSWLAGLRILASLGVSSDTTGMGTVVDIVVTGLIISGGTEGVNSIVKFLGYAKENQKEAAMNKTPSDQKQNLDAMHQ